MYGVFGPLHSNPKVDMSGPKSDDEIVVEVYMSLYLKALTIGIGNELENGIKITEKLLSHINHRLQILLERLYYKKNSLGI